MKKWKENWKEKKNKIEKMEKIKLDEREYQGEMKDKKRHGFGITSWLKGKF